MSTVCKLHDDAYLAVTFKYCSAARRRQQMLILHAKGFRIGQPSKSCMQFGWMILLISSTSSSSSFNFAGCSFLRRSFEITFTATGCRHLT